MLSASLVLYHRPAVRPGSTPSFTGTGFDSDQVIDYTYAAARLPSGVHAIAPKEHPALRIRSKEIRRTRKREEDRLKEKVRQAKAARAPAVPARSRTRKQTAAKA